MGVRSRVINAGGNDYNFLTLAGDEPDTLSCYLIDKAKDQIYDLHSKLNFTPNAILGNMDHPYRIVLSPKFSFEKSKPHVLSTSAMMVILELNAQ